MPPETCPSHELVQYRLDDHTKRLDRLEDRLVTRAELAKFHERVDLLAESNVAMASSLSVLKSGQLTRGARATIFVALIGSAAAVASQLIAVVWG